MVVDADEDQVFGSQRAEAYPRPSGLSEVEAASFAPECQDHRVVGDYEAAAESARATMVQRLRAMGRSEATLAASASVPRHHLVDRFWTLPNLIGEGRTVAVEHREGDIAGVRMLHRAQNHTLAVKPPSRHTGVTTSTASAPALLAVQTDLLALTPGIRVLEIGTGPGYFAAVLAELVGPNGRVVTIDIDEADSDRRHVAPGAARIRQRHGARPRRPCRARDLGPFDRVVGSVGCTDIAAAWLDQLVSGGNALIPLLHGAMHPMVQLDASGVGRIVTRSGYVAQYQGVQHRARLWPNARAAAAAPSRASLPPDLAAALVVTPDRCQLGGLGEWNLAFWVALQDQRAGSLVELNDGAGSSTRASTRVRARCAWGGPTGRALTIDLVAHGNEWLAAGRPEAEDFTHAFVPRGSTTSGDGWVIPRGRSRSDRRPRPDGRRSVTAAPPTGSFPVVDTMNPTRTELAEVVEAAQAGGRTTPAAADRPVPGRGRRDGRGVLRRLGGRSGASRRRRSAWRTGTSPTCRIPRAFPGWFSTLIRTATARRTRRRQLALVPLDGVEIADSDKDPTSVVTDDEDSVRLRAAVELLPEPERAVVALHYLGDLPYSDVAAFLGIGLSAAKASLHRSTQTRGSSRWSPKPFAPPARVWHGEPIPEHDPALRRDPRPRHRGMVPRLVNADPSLAQATEDWSVDEALEVGLPRARSPVARQR